MYEEKIPIVYFFMRKGTDAHFHTTASFINICHLDTHFDASLTDSF